MFEGGFTFWNFLVDAFVIFIFILWLWLLISVFADLFRRHDVSGAGKVIWVIFLIVLPYLGVFIYLLTQSGGMAERQAERNRQAVGELQRMVGYSTADELKKLNDLKASGAVTEAEYNKLRAKLIS